MRISIEFKFPKSVKFVKLGVTDPFVIGLPLPDADEVKAGQNPVP